MTGPPLPFAMSPDIDSDRSSPSHHRVLRPRRGQVVDYVEAERRLDSLLGIDEDTEELSKTYRSKKRRVVARPNVASWRKKVEVSCPAQCGNDDFAISPVTLPSILFQEGFRRPRVVLRDSCDSVEETRRVLGLHLPLEILTPRGLVATLGPDVDVPTFDVATQTSGPSMTVEELAEYHEQDSSKRLRLINVVSLSLADTDLAERISVPRAVQHLDLVKRAWPAELDPRPNTLMYILMGPEGAYTDWHVDMGGSAVWYHVIRGHKVFLLAPPNEKNMTAYSQWSSSANQALVFLGDHLENCVRVVLREGDTLFLPSGWPHAVSTVKDSFVIGGNYLHPLDYGTVATVHRQEVDLGVTMKFQYPLLKSLLWFAAQRALNRLKDCGESSITVWEWEGLPKLCSLLREWIRDATPCRGGQLRRKTAGVPDSIEDAEALILEIEGELCSLSIFPVIRSKQIDWMYSEERVELSPCSLSDETSKEKHSGDDRGKDGEDMAESTSYSCVATSDLYKTMQYNQQDTRLVNQTHRPRKLNRLDDFLKDLSVYRSIAPFHRKAKTYRISNTVLHSF